MRVIRRPKARLKGKTHADYKMLLGQQCPEQIC